MAGPTLSATLTAKLDQYKADLSQAGDLAAKAVDDIEQKFKDANPQLGNLNTSSGLGGIANLLGPIGKTALAIAGVTAAVAEMNKNLADTDESARTAGLSLGRFQELQFAFQSGGASSSSTTTGLTGLAKLLSEAQTDENSLTKLLDENNIKYKDRNGIVISTNAALLIMTDLISRAPNPQLEKSFATAAGLSEEMVKQLRQGPAALEDLTTKARESGSIISQETVDRAKQFDTEWRQSSVNWLTNMKAAVAGILPAIDDLITKATQFVKTFDAASVVNTLADKVIAAGIAFELPDKITDEYISTLAPAQAQYILALFQKNGQEIEEQWKVMLQNIVLAAANAGAQANQALVPDPSKVFDVSGFKGLQGTNLDYLFNPSKPSPGSSGSDSDAFSRAEDTIKKRTQDYIAEANAVGLDADAKARLKAVADLNSAADRAGIDLTEKQKQAISDLSVAYGQAAQQAANAKQKFDASNQALQFAGDQTISVLDGIRTGSLTGAQAVQQLSNALITALEKAVLLGQGPLAGILGFSAAAGSGGTGGLLGSIFGLSGGSGGAGSSFGKFAGGTDSAPGGMALVGENGPELVNLPRGSQVIPNDVVRSMAGGGGGDINMSVSIDLKGANGDDVIVRTVKAGMAIAVKQAVDQANAQGPARQVRAQQLGQ